MIYKPADYTGPSDFVHYHAHSIYSSMDGVSTIPEYAQACYDRKWGGMALTEHGHMGSVPDLYLEFTARGLKPIYGCEIYYNDWEPERQRLEAQGIKVRSLNWRRENQELAARIARNRHLTVLCKNETGLHNLIKLTTQAYSTGLFGMGTTQFNRIWFDKLCEYKEGLIVLSGCLNGPLAHEIRHRNFVDREGNIIRERPKSERLDAVREYIKKFKAVFGEDYYMELQMPGIPGDDHTYDDAYIFRFLVQLADRYKIKTILTNDTHYLRRKDFVLQKIMMAVSQGVTIDSPDLFHVNSDEQFFKTRAELWATFKNGEYSKGVDDRCFEEMCDNTAEIFDKCESVHIDNSPKIPNIDAADQKLTRLVAEGLRQRGLDKCTKKFLIDGREVTYQEQAQIELERFIDKGTSSYFLITSDLVQFGKKRGFSFSARGSAAGSLVCYLLGIQGAVDPMLWGLSFDRFMSPSRGGYMLNLRMPKAVNA